MAEQIKNLGKVFVTPEGEWDINKEYDRLALVNGIDTETNELMSFLSRKAVPAGSITLDNKLYWQKFTSKVHFEDITLREDGWIYIGDEPVYEVTLHDAIGQAVVDKIEEGLTEKIMTAVTAYMTDTVNELKRYMGGVVNDFVAAITNQITRLVVDGIKVNNINSGSINQNIQGSINQNVKGSLDTKQSGEVLTKLSGGINAGVVVQGNIDNNLDGKVKVEHEGIVNNINSGSINSNVAVSGGIMVDDGEPEPPATYTITVNSNPNTAKVTLDGVETRSKAFVEGSTVLVVVSQEGYVTQTRTISNLTQDTTINVTLVAKDPSYFFGAQPLNNNISADGGTIDCLVISLKDSKIQDYNYTTEGSIIDAVNKLESNLIITIKPNTDTSAKSGKVILTQVGSNKQLTVLINQSAAEAPEDEFILTSSMSSMNFEASGGTINPGIVSTKNGTNIGYNITSKPNWITENNGSFTASSNTSGNDRSGYILITQNESGKTLVIQVSQPGVVPDEYVFTAQNTQLNISANGGATGTALVSTKNGNNINYTVSDTPDWITPTIMSSALSIGVSKNTSTEARTATITLIQDESGNTITIVLTQAGKTPDEYVFTAQQNEISFDAIPSNPIIVPITSTKNGNNIGYNISTYPDWIEVVQGTNQISVDVNENLVSQAKTATITLIQLESGNTINIVVNQAKATVEFSIGLVQDLSKEQQTLTLDVVSKINGRNYQFAVISSPDWITDPIYSTSGVQLNVERNVDFFVRNGTISIQQEGSGTIEDVSIRQLGRTAIFNLKEPYLETFNASGGTDTQGVNSIVDGAREDYVVSLKPDWVTTSIAYNGNLDVRVGVSPGSYREGVVTLLQRESRRTITLTVKQNVE